MRIQTKSAMQQTPIRNFSYANARSKGYKSLSLNIGQARYRTPKVFMEAVRAADIDVLPTLIKGWSFKREHRAAYYQRMAYVCDRRCQSQRWSEALQWALFNCLRSR